MKVQRRIAPEVSAGSMADIAFLLLIFFLVTTTIASDKGLGMLLPPNEREPTDLHDRNVFAIILNSRNDLLVENEPKNLESLKEEAKGFINNQKKKKNWSDSPKIAVISIKTDRGTEYLQYIKVLDEVKAAYHELRADALGISLEEYLALEEADQLDEKMLKKLEDVRTQFPMRISEAEPSAVRN